MRYARHFTYDGASRLIVAADQADRHTSYLYDVANRVIRRTYDDGSIEELLYGSGATAGLLASLIDRNGAPTTYAYDAAGRRIETRIADGLPEVSSEVVTWSSGSSVRIASRLLNGDATTMTYDPQAHLIADTVFPRTGQALVRSNAYDHAERRFAASDVYGRWTYRVFDDLDRVIRTVQELVPGALGTPDQVRAAAIAAAGIVGTPTAQQTTLVTNAYLASLARDLSVNPGYVIEESDYDGSGALIAHRDGRAIPSTTTYDSQVRVAATTEAAGTADAATTTFAYDAQGNHIRVTNPRGFATVMSYTGRNLMAEITQAFGTASAATTVSSYSPTHKLATTTDALGRVTTLLYCVCCDRLETIIDPAGFMTTLAYDFVGNRTSVTDANGLATLTTYDGRNRPVTVTNGAGETTTTAYSDDASALPEAAGLGLGAGADGSAVSTTNPLGERSLSIADGIGRTVRQVDGLGHQTTLVYDALVADGGVTLVALRTIDPLGHATAAYQDGADRTRVRLDALGLRSTAGFDAAGNRVAWRDASGVGQDCLFDARNREVACTDTAGAVTHQAYDANNNRVTSTDALAQVETTVFDARDRKASTTDRIGATTAFAYDAVSNLVSITDVEGGVTLYRYELRDLLDREVFPAGQGVRTARYYGYDPGRRLISRAVAGIPLVGVPPDAAPLPNELTTYGYDAANRLIERGYPDHLNDAFAYDAASRVTAANSARYANQVARLYDAAGRLTKETLSFTSPGEAADLPVSYAYDADNQLTQLTYPDGSQVQRAYTPRHELEHIWDGGVTQIVRGYDAGGRLGHAQYGNGLQEFRTYVANDRLTASIATTGNVDNFTYAYDANKRKTEEHDWQVGGNSQRFTYDGQSRVIGWNRGNGVTDAEGETDAWNLSPVGDWTTFNRVPGTGPASVENRTHDPVHELLAINGLALGYDAKGDLTHDHQNQDFAWDFENRLRAADHLAQGQGDSATYGYDALGRRVKKAVTTAAQTVPTYFVNAGAQEVVAISGDITAFNDPAADPEDAGAAPYSPATGEGARGSLLADPTATRFNFQPASSDTPDGWLADSGAVQPTPASRGWSDARIPVDRDHLGRPLYDTFIPVDTATWKLPVANGTHALVIMCGDADSRAQTNNVVVNGISLLDPTPYDGLVTLGYETGSFDGYALTVNVIDGFVTIHADAGALDPKINFIEVAPVGTAIDPATTARVQAAAEKATHDTAKPKAKLPPSVKRTVWGTYVDELIAYTRQKPRHAAQRFYVHANHLYSIAAITSSTGAVVERWSYSAYGVPTITDPAATVLAQSAVGNDRGFTGYMVDYETGLMNARSRMYSAELGRFVSRDEAYVDGYSLYGAYFIPNDNDPTGLCRWSPIDGVGNQIKNMLMSIIAARFSEELRDPESARTINDILNGIASAGNAIGHVTAEGSKDTKTCVKVVGNKKINCTCCSLKDVPPKPDIEGLTGGGINLALVQIHYDISASEFKHNIDLHCRQTECGDDVLNLTVKYKIVVTGKIKGIGVDGTYEFKKDYVLKCQDCK